MLKAGNFCLAVRRPLLMGIINITPDSFSDGGDCFVLGKALQRAWQHYRDGADLIDLGAESTRPGSLPVSVQEEKKRLEPVLRALSNFPLPISVDTTKPEVMDLALHYGASMINDINALQTPGAIEVAQKSNAAFCLMHKKGEPKTMQNQPFYEDVVTEVCHFLAERTRALQEAGIARNRIVLDPGFGFGKTLEHNWTLLEHLPSLCRLGFPVLVGLSRKSMLKALGAAKNPANRLLPSLQAAQIAAVKGAHIFRVHDVGYTWLALRNLNQGRVSCANISVPTAFAAGSASFQSHRNSS
jgi:dihydropteroate synthase